jgi:hypothetical protein
MATEQPFFQQIRNTANVSLDVVLAAVNTVIGLAYTQANNAYTQANNGVGTAQSAYAQANLAFNQANTATSVGQAAFAQANTAASAAATAASAASAAQNTANQGISATGVTAGAYGTGTRIAAFTVGANGRLSQANTIAIPDFSTSTDGLVKAPASSANNIFLASDGSFLTPLGGGNQSIAASGWTTLPGGLILQWGSFSAPGGLTGTIGFPKGFPTGCFQVQVSLYGQTGTEFWTVESFDAGGFTYYSNNSGTVYYFAIGH